MYGRRATARENRGEKASLRQCIRPLVEICLLATMSCARGSLVFVVHGKGSADEEKSSGGTEIVGRDTEVLGIGCSVRRAKIGGGVGVYVGIPSANAEWKAIGIAAL